MEINRACLPQTGSVYFHSISLARRGGCFVCLATFFMSTIERRVQNEEVGNH
jgi:hypothetical protein